MPIGGDEYTAGVIATNIAPKPALEYRLNPSNNDCKCCVNPLCEEVDEAFIRSEISGIMAAERLGVSPAYYSIHIHRDVQRAVKEEVAKSPVVQGAIRGTIDKVGELASIFSALVDRANLLLQEPLDAKAEFRIKAIASEARAYGRFLMEVEGELKDSPLIVINNMTLQFNKVIELIMTEASPSLKQKLSIELKKMDLEAYR